MSFLKKKLPLEQQGSREYPHALKLNTTFHTAALIDILRKWEPWGHRIEFSNGVTTAMLQRRVPFSDAPLSKISHAEEAVPFF